MNNPETCILKQNRFNGHLVDLFTDEKKALIYKAPTFVRNFDETTKLVSRYFLNVSIAKEKEQACSVVFETKEKEYFFVEKKCFFIVRYYRNG